MITQHEVAVFGHLVGEFNIGFPDFAAFDIVFTQGFIIDHDGAVFAHIYPVSGLPDYPFQQHFVVVVKSDNVAAGEAGVATGYHQVPISQGGGHGLASDLQYRHKESRNQDSDGAHD